MTVVTGVSGSGKSSLAFDTIYAEGQRRYVESLSAYARQFLERMDKPDVDEVRGIAPAIAIRQKNSTRNPRSTVGTQTEIYDYLRCSSRVSDKLIAAFVDGKSRATRRNQSPTKSLARCRKEHGSTCCSLPSAGLSDPERECGNAETRRKQSRRVAASPHRRVSGITAHLMSLMQRGFTRLFVDGQTIELQSPDDYTRDDFEDVYRAGRSSDRAS